MTDLEIVALEKVLAQVEACNRSVYGCQGGGGKNHPHETWSIRRDIAAVRAHLAAQTKEPTDD